ncbi:NADPH-Cytochrome P450 reductase [Acrasis kona]|uniref:NADPH-Cytochrome P450 reductase n=1 Tax=Acrasis kona TaxID=1008807 RepID=A0AAW2ZPC1_9EUKA
MMKVSISYATQGGTSELFAHQLSNELNSMNHLEVSCASIAEFEEQSLVGNTNDLNLFIISTVGGGEPPESMTDFYDWLMDLEAGSLPSIKYSIFGIGNSNYKETYQKASRAVIHKLADLVGCSVAPCMEGDASTADLDIKFSKWTDLIKQCCQQ